MTLAAALRACWGAFFIALRALLAMLVTRLVIAIVRDDDFLPDDFADDFFAVDFFAVDFLPVDFLPVDFFAVDRAEPLDLPDDFPVLFFFAADFFAMNVLLQFRTVISLFAVGVAMKWWF